MAGPIVFVGTHRIHDGKLDIAKEASRELAAFVQANHPRILHFAIHVDDATRVMTVVQVHPDADSMATHMNLIVEHISESYAEYLEPESTVQIYGTLTDELAQTVAGAAQGSTDETVAIREPFAGFSRLPAV